MIRLVNRGLSNSWPTCTILRQRPCRYQSIASNEPRAVQTSVYGIYGSVNGTPVHATAASETRLNIISADFAKECRLEIGPLKHSCTLANSTRIESIGKATGIWQFDGEFFQRAIEFLVLPESSRPVVLGLDFLSRTRTLKTNWHRIRSRRVFEEPFYCLHLLDHAPRVIAGTVNGEPVLAIPSTGCEMNLVSESYLQRRGLDSRMLKDDAQQVKLADGSLAQTTGRIRMRWRFGDEGLLDSWSLTFLVMRDCLYDVVLGQDLLYQSNAFLQYEDCFRDVDSARIRSTGFHAGIASVPFFMLAFQRKQGMLLTFNCLPKQ